MIQLFPLTHPQKRIWYTELVNPGTNIGNICFTCKLPREWDNFTRLSQGINKVIQRNEALRLRLTLREEDVKQYVHPYTPREIECKTFPDQGITQDKWIHREIQKPFTLTDSDLFNFVVIKGKEEGYTLWIKLHHLIADAWSCGLLTKAIYQAYLEEEDRVLTAKESHLKYLDYLDSEEKYRKSPRMDQNREFWQNHLSQRERSNLFTPTLAPAPAERITFELPAELEQRMEGLLQEGRFSLFTLLFAHFILYLYQYTGQRDLIVGTLAHNRIGRGEKNTLGTYVNTLGLGQRIDPEESFLTRVERTSLLLSKALKNQKYPFDQLLEDLESQNTKGQPLLDCVFSYDAVDYPFPITWYPNKTEIYPLILHVTRRKNNQGLLYELDYQTSHFTREEMLHFSQGMISSLEGALSTPEIPVSQLPAVSQEQAELVQKGFNDTCSDYPRTKGLITTFRDNVESHPHIGALREGSQEISYQELDRQSDHMASWLISQGVKPGELVPLLSFSSIDLYITILALVKARCGYLPIDPNYPRERIQFILQDSGAKNLIGKEELIDPISFSGNKLSITEGKDYPLQDLQQPCPEGDNILYCIYTSGSTGKPKGVLVPERGIRNMVFNHQRVFPTAPGTSFSQVASVGFDAMAFELWPCLIQGGTLCIAPEEVKADPRAMKEWLHTSRIGVSFQSTAIFKQLLKLSWASDTPLQYLRTAGDYLDSVPVKDYPFRLFNLYGPTEASIWSTYCEITDPAGYNQNPHIGRPLGNVRIYILGSEGQLLPPGAPGELCIAGEGLAKGYLNRTELTEERFRNGQAPLSERIYHSGDRARWTPKGEVEFIGRLDNQVKIRGYRIELGEIEGVLQSYGPIEQGLARVLDQKGSKILCAYYTSHEEVNKEDLRRHLQNFLPPYMIPQYLCSLLQLPLTVHGKIDYKALPHPKEEQNEIIEGVSEMEKLLVDIWQKVLGFDSLGITDNFFHRGGDSIKAIMVASELHKRGYQVSVPHIQNYPTIAELQHKVTQKEQPVQRDRRDSHPLSPIQHWFFQQPFTPRSYWNHLAVITSQTPWDSTVLTQSLTKIINHHQELRTIFPNGKPRIRPSARGASYFAGKNLASPDELNKHINIQQGPLIVYGVLQQNQGCQLAIAIHHLIIDGVSWRILLEDLTQQYQAYLKGTSCTLPPETDSYATWTEELESFSQHHLLLREVPYWKKQGGHPSPIRRPQPPKPLRKDSFRDFHLKFEGETTKRLLEEANRAYNTNPQDLLLTALLLAFHHWRGTEHLPVALESHGRMALRAPMDLTRTLGWFTSLYPHVLDLPEDRDLRQVIIHIKEGIRRIPRQGIGYGILQFLTPKEKRKGLTFENQPDISFNYLGVIPNNLAIHLGASPECPMPYALEINAFVTSGELEIQFGYAHSLFSHEDFNHFIRLFKESLTNLINHCRTQETYQLTGSDYGDVTLTNTDIDSLPQEIIKVVPLSPLQQGMLLKELQSEETGAYLEQITFRFTAPLKAAEIQQNYQRLVRNHEILRTVFLHQSQSTPRQGVLKNSPVDFTYQDLSHLPRSEADEELKHFGNLDRNQRFPLETSPPHRLRLYKLGDQEHAFLFTFHHILMDGWSVGLMLQQLFTPRSLESAPFSHYMEWLERQNFSEAQIFWENYLKDLNPPVPLPGQRRSPSSYLQQESTFVLEEEIYTPLDHRRQKENLTWGTLLQVAWGAFLQIYTQEENISFGWVVSGRTPEIRESDSILGLMINTVPVTTKGFKPFSRLLQEAKTNFEAIQKHSYFPLGRIIEILGFSPINHLVVLENYPLPEGLRHNLKDLEVYEQGDYDFNMIIQQEQGLTFTFRYNQNVLSHQVVREIFRGFRFFLTQLPQFWHKNIQDISLLDPREEEKILGWSTGKQMAFPEDSSLWEIFKNKAHKHPNRSAIVTQEGCISYSKLYSQVEKVSGLLQQKGVKQGSSVALYLPPSPEMIISILALFSRRCRYIPLAMDLPEWRLQYILKDCRAQDLITLEDLSVSSFFKGTIHPVDLYINQKGSSISVTSPVEFSQEDPAYTIYTSGSTGHPKGVAVTQGNLLNTLWALQDQYPMTEGDAFLLKTSYAFDVSLSELLGWILGEGHLVIPRAGEEREPDRLLRAIDGFGITHINFVPSLLELFLQEALPRAQGKLTSLKYVFSAGEELTPSLIKQFFSLKIKASLENLYGPTEGTIYATGTKVSPETTAPVSIGRPFANTGVYILNEDNKLCPLFVPGELYLTGAGIVSGYLNRPDLTAERFVPDPFIPNRVMYRTGDLAQWNEKGEIEYLGRLDDQVKIRGNRVELQEIQRTLEEVTGIDQARVVVKKDPQGHLFIAAYYTSRVERKEKDLQYHLTSKLPSYMIPLYIMQLQEFPMTTSGKVNSGALPEPVPSKGQDKPFIAPRNPREVYLTHLWQDILGHRSISITDNFFDLGGNSLKAIQLYSRLKEDYALHLNDLFDYETIETLAAHLQEKEEKISIREKRLKSLFKLYHAPVENREITREILTYKENAPLLRPESLRGRITYENILLTGATGYLGIHLLENLLRTTQSHIHLLIRTQSPLTCEDRLINKWIHYFPHLDLSQYKDRLSYYPADLSLPSLGLSPHHYSLLEETIDCIINGAAKVSHYGDEKDFMAINVKALEELLTLAQRGRPKDINHISTLSVGAAGLEDKEYFVFHEGSILKKGDHKNLYIKSKLQGERLVEEHRRQGYRAQIFRVGNIVFQRDSGIFQTNIAQNGFYRSVKSYIRLNKFPIIKHNTIDFSYVDEVSEAISLLFNREDLPMQTFHILNDQVISIYDFANLIKENGFWMEGEEYGDFLTHISQDLGQGPKRQYAENLLIHSPHLENPKLFRLFPLSQHTQELLHSLGFHWTKPKQEQIKLMLNYCQKVGFI